MVSDTHRWLLCTGQPGSGKTTLVRRLYETLSDKGVSLRGFYTDEVLDKPGGTRIGFDIVTIPNEERGILSRKRGLPTTFPRTGAYVVDVASFESLALPSISCPSHNNNNNNNDITVIVIDEIGRMELHSNEFQHCIQQLLASPSVRVIGAITSPIYGHRVPFCDDITSRPEVSVRRITKKNRDAVYDEMLTEVLSLAGVV